jgi:hypothetical protein
MNHNYNFKLIDGTFNSSEASLILFNLISSKIDFHTLENFSSQERFGKELPESQSRIRALKEVREDLKKMFNVAEKEEVKLKIESFVKINIEKQTDL